MLAEVFIVFLLVVAIQALLETNQEKKVARVAFEFGYFPKFSCKQKQCAEMPYCVE